MYGSKKSFEWGFADDNDPYVPTAIPAQPGRRGGSWITEQTAMPNYYLDLPEELRPFTVGGDYDPLNPQDSLRRGAGAGHHGFHPRLVHEFLSSIAEGRQPWIDEELGANITATGSCAHASAMAGGEAMVVRSVFIAIGGG